MALAAAEAATEEAVVEEQVVFAFIPLFCVADPAE